MLVMAIKASLRYRRWSPRQGVANPAYEISRLASPHRRRRPERQPPPRPRGCPEDVWRLARSPLLQRVQLLAVFGDVCWICWDEPGTYVDHVRPLWSLTDEERRELRWWMPFNTQLAGPACHREKTAREARERALLRQAQPLERRRVASVA